MVIPLFPFSLKKFNRSEDLADLTINRVIRNVLTGDKASFHFIIKNELEVMLNRFHNDDICLKTIPFCLCHYIVNFIQLVHRIKGSITMTS